MVQRGVGLATGRAASDTDMAHGAGEAEVAVGGRDLSQWTFDSNNVLAWGDEAGYTAWLQFTVLPGGPVFMGTLHPSGEADGAGERPPPPSPSHCPWGD